jgi:Holliday junction resolvase RusA-like endonuclease
MSEWKFPINPRAASRPRLSRHGAYFKGPYKEFRNEMLEIIPEVLGDGFIPMDGELHVDIALFVKQPKKTKLIFPRADIDNFIKAVLDSLNGYLWEDDSQISSVYAIKQWAIKEEPGYFTVQVSTKEEI